MFHRFSTWWRALVVVLLSLATVPWPSAAQAATTPSVDILHQDAVAALSREGATTIGVAVRISPFSPAHVRIALFARIVDRSQINSIVDGAGVSGAPATSTTQLALDCTQGTVARLRIQVYTHQPRDYRGICSPQAPRLRLDCVQPSCDGVYPVRYTFYVAGFEIVRWSMLAVHASAVNQPVRVAIVGTLAPSSWRHARRTISVLRSIARFAASPVTLSADYRTLSTVEASTPEASAYRAALDAALTSPLHRAVSAPPSSIDFAGLAANGLLSEVRTQVLFSSDLLKAITGRYVDGPVLISGAPSVRSLRALREAGVNDVVLPEGDLVTPPSSTLTWGAPFHVAGVSTLTALASDAPLTELMADGAIEPGLRSTLILATIDFLHFQAPYAAAVRTVVITAPIESLSSLFVTDLLSGISHDPFATLATLTPSFESSLVGTNDNPAIRQLGTLATPSRWSAHNVTSLSVLIQQVTSFDDAVTSGNVGSELRAAVLAAEIVGPPQPRQDAINETGASLAREIGDVSVDPGSITLTGPGTTLPITLLSRATYSIDTVVHLLTNRLRFPKGSSAGVRLDAATKSVRFATANARGSSLTLQVLVTTPDGRVLLANSAIQVRIAGTSAVGYVLIVGSLLVLAYWWIRTTKRRSKGRHAR